MTLSVRMDHMLERELEQAAQRAGITKSQFIIDAVEKALGRKDPFGSLLAAHRQYGINTPSTALVARQPTTAIDEFTSAALRDKLVAKHDADIVDWLAYQAARQAGRDWHPDGDGPASEAAA